MLLGQECEEQASGMKGRSCTTGQEPLELTKQRITSMVKAMFPKACPEICGKTQMQNAGGGGRVKMGVRNVQ